MGWLFWNTPDNKRPLKVLRERDTKWWDEKVVKAAYSFNAVWMVIRTPAEKVDEYLKSVYVPEADGSVKGIAVLMIKTSYSAHDGTNFGYKDMDETSGPYGLEAPLSIIKAASALMPLTDAEKAKDYSGLKSAHDYRARSLAVAAAKAAKAKIKDGAKVTLPKPITWGGKEIATYTAVAGNFKVRGRKVKMAFLAEGYGLVSLTAANLAGATVE